MKLTKEWLKGQGWIERGDFMVRYSDPRVGWKEDGTLIIGYHAQTGTVATVEQLRERIGEVRP